MYSHKKKASWGNCHIEIVLPILEVNEVLTCGKKNNSLDIS